MHDYYRIADVWDGSRRASHVQWRAPWWRAVPGSSAPAGRLRLGDRARGLEPDAPPASWRDDAALDFPSLAGPADRMCRAFLAQAEPLTRCMLAIEVPRRRTARVSRVPTEVVVPAACGTCGGRGEAWGDPCPTCDGTGVEAAPRYVVLRVPAGVQDGARLRYRLEAPHASLLLDVRVHVR